MKDVSVVGDAGQSIRPDHVAVIGAGVVGLSTAWFLQDNGVQVTVYDKAGAGGGASWGNAGWLTPSLVAPLPEPAMLRYGIRAVLDRRSPVFVPLRADWGLARFMAGFLRASTSAQWRAGMAGLVSLNRWALDAFDVLADGGVQAPTHEAEPFLAAYRTTAGRDALLREVKHLASAGQPDVQATALTGDQARAMQPMLSREIGAAVQLHGQRYIHPPEFLRSLAQSVVHRGGHLVEGVPVTDLVAQPGGVVVQTPSGEQRFDACVVATGAELPRLVRRFGVRQPLQAGRGYSFSVPVEQVPAGPLYFPEQRVACTPLGGRLRVAGMMEFRQPDAALDPRRIRAIVDAVQPLLTGADLDDRRSEWVGSRPCTADGLPLIGATSCPRIHVAGGHGMWGITLGPVTGLVMAESLVKGQPAAGLEAFDPLR
ncbi:NAD(P)/FAD-dependent oxidoreductase [Klenkia terrae]|jgi:glycine/D-amino acid oxidase-like deaminating enzyme|uniref:FAD-dependent oxidoreductase n=2 Tax=Klenkia terrae TaxID=1052259 RepID=A0ABU8E582_9ACTN|nr:FAD-dependent oxidoreductase [Klenkia terrae]